MSIKICVAGKGRIAINALRDVIRVAPAGSELYAAFNRNEDGVDRWQPSFRKFVDECSSVREVTLEEAMHLHDLVFISTEFDRLIRPDRFCGNPCLVNLHFSLLPAYKGMFTSALPILYGEAQSGCTLHLIDAGIDTGAIVAQTAFPIAQKETCKTLYAKYVEHGSALIGQYIERILSRSLNAIPQGFEGSSYYSVKTLDYANLSIDWKRTAEHVERQIRAFNHRSYQLPTYDGRPITIASISGNRSILKPGSLIRSDAFTRTVATIDFDVICTIDAFDDLIAAVRSSDLATVRTLVKHDASLLEETGQRGWSPLMVAAFEGLDGSVQTLLELGADPLHANQKGTTPLMYAKEAFLATGNATPSRMLIAAGGDPNARDMYGRDLFDYLTDEQERAYRQDVLDL